MINNEIAYKTREDGHTISTISSIDGWYGKYETAIGCKDYGTSYWKIVEGYNTVEEALLGHDKYIKMSSEELDNLPKASMTEVGENSINRLKELLKERLRKE